MTTDIVLGAFFGDEGKGQCVNNLCSEGSIVIRFSGTNQVGHNVKHNNITHCFRNFGSGTLKNIPTYWDCVCDLFTMSQERQELLSVGITPTIIYNPLCELITPYDVFTQRRDLENLSHGTVGTGYKPTLDRIAAGYHLTIKDAKNLLVLKSKIINIAEHYYNNSTSILNEDLQKWITIVNEMANSVEFASREAIQNIYNNLIFEGSQGILLDQIHGIMPYCTPSYTTSKNVFERYKLIKNVTTHYVCRPYITRHGKGPLLTETPIKEVTDINNPYNVFQGNFRACEFDLELLKHSIDIDRTYNYGIKDVIFSHGSELDKELELKYEKELHCNIRRFEFEEWLF